jgi:hypothetical protein
LNRFEAGNLLIQGITNILAQLRVVIYRQVCCRLGGAVEVVADGPAYCEVVDDL